MHTGRSLQTVRVSRLARRDIYVLIVLGVLLLPIPDGNVKWLEFPGRLVGGRPSVSRATAFIVCGFKNLQSYNRTWEARQYGATS